MEHVQRLQRACMADSLIRQVCIAVEERLSIASAHTFHVSGALQGHMHMHVSQYDAMG